MPVPSAYTETELSQFMIDTLGDVASVINRTSIGDYEEEVIDALLLYGVTTVADASNIAKIRACAKVAAWRKALTNLITRYNFQTDQQRFERIEMAKMARNALLMAEEEAASHGAILGSTVEVGAFSFPEGAYDPARDEDFEY